MVSLKAMPKGAKSKKKAIITKKAPKPEPTYKSTEFIEDSDQEEEDKKSDEESEQESEQESDSKVASPSADNADIFPKINGKFVAPDGSSSSSENESDSDDQEEEGSGDDGDTDEAEASEPGEEATAAAEPVKKPTKEPVTKTVSFITAPYKPPTGFEQGRLEGSSKSSQIFKKSNLDGKQIWYFTAPASVPISTVEHMSWLDVKNGNAVLNYEGGDYGFLHDSGEDKTHTKIMVPSSSDGGYRTAPREIDQILHLQRVVKLPGVHEGVASNVTSTSMSTAPAKRPARPQPKGLRMRFRPLGFGSGKTGEIGSGSDRSSDEETEDVRTFRIPVLADSDEEMADPPPPKPAKKDKAENPASSTPVSLKRKHIEGSEKKEKKSSSTTAPDDKKLKRLKKKQTESQANIADKPSPPTRPMESTKPNPQQEAAILPPKIRKSSQASDLKRSSQPIQSLQNLDANKKDPKSPAGKDFSQELAHNINPDMSTEEERKERKRLKKLKRKRQNSSSQID